MSALALFLINEAYKELPGCEDLHCLRIGVCFFCFIRARIHVWVVLDRVTSTLSWCRCRRAARCHWAGNLGQERHWRKGSSPHILLFHLKLTLCNRALETTTEAGLPCETPWAELTWSSTCYLLCQKRLLMLDREWGTVCHAAMWSFFMLWHVGRLVLLAISSFSWI